MLRIALALFLALSAALIAEDAEEPAPPKVPQTLTTVGGKIYREVQLKRLDPGGIVITHAEGISRVGFLQIPPDLREKLGMDVDEAMKAEEAYHAAQKQLRMRQLQEQLAADNRKIDEQIARRERMRQATLLAEAETIEFAVVRKTEAGILARYVESIAKGRNRTAPAGGLPDSAVRPGRVCLLREMPKSRPVTGGARLRLRVVKAADFVDESGVYPGFQFVAWAKAAKKPAPPKKGALGGARGLNGASGL